MWQDTVAEEEREATNSNINEENQLEALGAETDAFQCGYCKQVCTPFVICAPLLTCRYRGSAVTVKHTMNRLVLYAQSSTSGWL